MASVFKQRPSAIARDLFPELSWLSPYDWYAFDVAATAIYFEIEKRTAAKTDDPPSLGRRGPHGRFDPPSDIALAPGRAIVQDNRHSLAIRGTEIPPWER